MTLTQTPAEIVAQLNTYTDDNIWQDVILTLADYDEDATVAADESGRSDRFVLADGTMIEWVESATDGEQWRIHTDHDADRWAMLTDINDVHPNGRSYDTIGIFRNHVMVDTVPVESAEDQDPYDAALTDAGWGGVAWMPGQF